MFSARTYKTIYIDVNLKKFTRILVIAFLMLLIAHIGVVVLKYKLMPESNLAERLDQFFNFDREVNFPTYFNTILLFLAAQTFFLIALQGTHTKFYFKTYWYILSFAFLFLGVDEFVRIHEWFIGWMPELFGLGGTGILKFAWIIPYGILTILFGLYSIKFLLSIEKTFLKGYVICGAYIFWVRLVLNQSVEWLMNKMRRQSLLNIFYFIQP